MSAATRVLTALSATALVAALGFAYWASRERPEPSAAAGSAARSDQHAAPFEAFARAKVGDWRAYRVVNSGSMPVIRSIAIEEVTDAGEAEVAVARQGKLDSTGETRTSQPSRFPRAGLTLERLTGLDVGEWTVLDLAVGDDVRVIDGRSFPCKKLVFHSRDPMFADKTTVTELWLSTDVPVTGVVAEREHQELRGMTFDAAIDLVGFGTGAVVAWGERPSFR